MERKSVLRSVTGAITRAAAGRLASPALSEAATLPCSSSAGPMGRNGGELRQLVTRVAKPYEPRVPAAAEGRCDGEEGRRCPRGTAFHPRELVARPGAETACPCHRAGLAGGLFHRGRAILDHPGMADRRLRPGLCHGDVRERFDHRCPAVCPGLHPAFACPPRDRKWISLHGAHVNPVDADLSGRLHARWPAWRRAAEQELALSS